MIGAGGRRDEGWLRDCLKVGLMMLLMLWVAFGIAGKWHHDDDDDHCSFAPYNAWDFV